MTLSVFHRRTLIRALHIALALPVGTLVYAPDDLALAIRPWVQMSLYPVMAATGLWMWQGHRLLALRGVARTRTGAAR